jgi:hypothetical protein
MTDFFAIFADNWAPPDAFSRVMAESSTHGTLGGGCDGTCSTMHYLMNCGWVGGCWRFEGVDVDGVGLRPAFFAVGSVKGIARGAFGLLIGVVKYRGMDLHRSGGSGREVGDAVIGNHNDRFGCERTTKQGGWRQRAAEFHHYWVDGFAEASLSLEFSKHSGSFFFVMGKVKLESVNVLCKEEVAL